MPSAQALGIVADAASRLTASRRGVAGAAAGAALPPPERSRLAAAQASEPVATGWAIAALPAPRSGGRLRGGGAAVAAEARVSAAPRPRRQRRLRRAIAARRRAGGGEGGAGPGAGLGGGLGGEEEEPAAAAGGPAAEAEDWLRDAFKNGAAFFAGVVGSLLTLLGQKQDAPKTRTGGRLVQQLGTSPVDAAAGRPVYSLGAFPECTAASDLRRPDRHFTIITTAALPWKTGPAVNALLRAQQLARRGHSVVLLMPWIEPAHQAKLFASGETFEDRADQEAHIRRWLTERAGLNAAAARNLELRWYEASYVEAVRSIFPIGDCSQDLGDGPRDVLVLEEPEHLCWYHNGQRWTELFRHVVGVVHTNYQAYLDGMGYEGIMGTAAFRDTTFFTFTSLVCSAYCDVTIKLSASGMVLPNEVVYNIHGVRDEFLSIGRRSLEHAAATAAASAAGAGEGGGAAASGGGGAASSAAASSAAAAADAYYIGKADYRKGWGALLTMLESLSPAETPPQEGESPATPGTGVCVDGFGSGPDWESIAARAEALQGACLRVHAAADHADSLFHGYKVLVNPSTTEMLCTVTAEALAMGKRAVLARHPSNQYFEDHFSDRCHFFAPGDATSFHAALRAALDAPRPGPLLADAEALLSWEDAVERFCSAAEVRVLSGSYSRPSEVAAARVAYEAHRGFQTQSMARVLKDATLKAETPWEKNLAGWIKLQSSKEIFEEADRIEANLQPEGTAKKQ